MKLTAICKNSTLTLKAVVFFPNLKLFHIIELTAILLLIGCLQVGAAGSGQRISITQRNATFVEIFNKIRMQTGCNFIYTSGIIQKIGKIDLDVKNESIENVLITCLKGQPFTYSILNNVRKK